MTTKILLVEDDQAILMGLKFCLEQEGFQVETALTKKEALAKIDSTISLILLDINLPDGNGFELLKAIPETISVIFLTANDEEVSIVKGLDMGAEDYVTKPFRTRELISRMHAVLRRKNKTPTKIIQLHDLKIDLDRAKVWKKSEEIFLTNMEYKILLILATNPNKVFTREQILADIWDVNEEYVNDNTLTVSIKSSREKIQDNPNDPKIILTVRTIGYKIEA